MKRENLGTGSVKRERRMFNPEIHHRKSIRMRDFDYAANGAYFVTICTQERECLFGEIRDREMLLNYTGTVVDSWWQDVSRYFMNVALDEYMIMPNHFHGIVVINDVGAGSPRPEVHNVKTNRGAETPPLRKSNLGQIVGYFKYQTAKQINRMRDNPCVPVWQRNYFERIIRDEAEIAAIREYISSNPARWAEDKENPDFM
jgi:REP element-mobilizing transposase RayT